MSEALRTTQDAKRFVIESVLAQARAEGTAFSKAEEYMLWWSETDPAFEQDDRHDLDFESQYGEATSQDYEHKVEALLRSAIGADSPEGVHATGQYVTAQELLAREDHYIAIMLDAALKDAQRPTVAGTPRVVVYSLAAVGGVVLAACISVAGWNDVAIEFGLVVFVMLALETYGLVTHRSQLRRLSFVPLLTLFVLAMSAITLVVMSFTPHLYPRLVVVTGLALGGPYAIDRFLCYSGFLHRPI